MSLRVQPSLQGKPLPFPVLHLPGPASQNKHKALPLTDLLDEPGLERADHAVIGGQHPDLLGRLKDRVKV